jgi:hypothetical protein
VDLLLFGLLLAPAPLLLAASLSARRVPSEHLLELLVQAQPLEEGALLAPDLVRGGGSLAPVLVGEDVRRVAAGDFRGGAF